MQTRRGKVLVTGGAGYIGSHTVHRLVECGYGVVVFDNLLQGHREALPERAVFVEGDLLDRAAVAALFQLHRFDAVLHLAGNASVGESMALPFLYLQDNVVAALNVIRAAVEHAVPKFVFSSTCNLFGAAGAVPVTEEEPVLPGSPYGESKHIIERMLHWADAVHGLRVGVMRYFNVAGAALDGSIGEAHDPETHLIPLAIDAALGRRPAVKIFGTDYPTPDGTCVRDYIHVCDLAEAHMRVLGALDAGSRCYNVGSGTGHSVLQIVDAVRRVTGREVRTDVAPRRGGDPPVLVASCERVRRDLDWAPRHSDLDTIIATAWAWRRRHPQGYGHPCARDVRPAETVRLLPLEAARGLSG